MSFTYAGAEVPAKQVSAMETNAVPSPPIQVGL